MLGFFKRDKNKIAKDGDDHTVDSMDLLGENTESTGKEVKTSFTFLHRHRSAKRKNIIINLLIMNCHY